MDTPVPRPEISGMAIEDIEALEEIEKQCFSMPWSADSLTQELSNPMAVYRTASIGGKIVGYVGMHHIIDEGYITNIAILPEYRRMGIAKRLIEHLLEYGEENGLRMITLEVRESNLPAQDLYQGFGFKKCGKRKNFYTVPTEDGTIMTREL